MQKFLIILFFSILSGVPISIFITIISAMLTEMDVNIAIITTFAIARLPYSLKIFFAPILDNIDLKIFNKNTSKRKSWMFVSSICSAALCIYVSFIFIDENLYIFKILCFLIAFSATIYDISWDALKIEMLTKEEMPHGINIANIGYAIGKTISGAGSLYLAVYTTWGNVFLYLGYVLLSFAFIMLFLPNIWQDSSELNNEIVQIENFQLNKKQNNLDINIAKGPDKKFHLQFNANFFKEYYKKFNLDYIKNIIANNLKNALTSFLIYFKSFIQKTFTIFIYAKKSIVEILTRKHIALILTSILFYKICDAMLSAVTMNFYLKVGFTKQEIAVVIKIYAALSALAGSTAGAFICKRYGIFAGLMLCGAAEGLTNCLYIIINHYPTYNVFVTNVIIENFTGGMGSCAIMIYISSIINTKFTAMQYGIFSSVISIANIYFTQYSGIILNYIGWDYYCLFTALLCLPSLCIIYYLNTKKIYNAK